MARVYLAEPGTRTPSTPCRPLHGGQGPRARDPRQAGRQGRARPRAPASSSPPSTTSPSCPSPTSSLHFREGARAPLVTPPPAAPTRPRPMLTPWSDAASPVTATSTFEITSGPRRRPLPAGRHAALQPGLQRRHRSTTTPAPTRPSTAPDPHDGEQDMTRFSADPAARACSASSPASPTAPRRRSPPPRRKTRQRQSSPRPPARPPPQIGRVLAGAGVGSALTYVPGKLYLAGPYNGAPLSVVAIVPAVAGPFDLGTVVVREALHVDPDTAEVEVDGAASDPIPHILAGHPAAAARHPRLRRPPHFTLNPTSCDPLGDQRDPVRRRRRRLQPRRRRPGLASRPASRPPTAPPRLQAEARAAASRAAPSAATTRPCTRRPHPAARATPTSARPWSPCRTRPSSTRPTSARSAPGSSSPPARQRRPVPRRLDLRQRQGLHAAARRAARRARSTCAPPATRPARPRRRPARASIDVDAGRPDRLRQRRHPRHLRQRVPDAPSPKFVVSDAGRQEGPARQLTPTSAPPSSAPTPTSPGKTAPARPPSRWSKRVAGRAPGNRRQATALRWPESQGHKVCRQDADL